MSIEQIYDFSIPGDYNVPAQAEIVGGIAKLKNQRLAGYTFGSKFNVDLSGAANWGDGVLSGTLQAGATITSETLDLSGGTNKHCDFAALGNANSQQTISIQIDIYPQYSGTPTQNNNYLNILKASGDTINLIGIAHRSSGNLRLWMRDENGVSNDLDLGIWSPTAGTLYRFLLCFDFTTGVQKVFINGAQFDGTQSVIMTRSSDIGLLRIGGGATGTSNNDFIADNCIISNTYTETEIDPVNIPDADYSKTPIETEFLNDFRNEGLDGFQESGPVVPSGDILQYRISKGGTKYWFDGVAWAISAGESESNTAAEIELNKASFNATPTDSSVFMILQSGDGSTTPEIDKIIINYDFAAEQDTCVKTLVYGFLINADCSIDAQDITATLIGAPLDYSNSSQVSSKPITVTTRASDGAWEVELLSGYSYEFEIQNTKKRKVVTGSTVSFNNLADAT